MPHSTHTTINALMWILGLPRYCGYDAGPSAGRVTRLLLIGLCIGTLLPYVVPEALDLAYRLDQPFAGAGIPLLLSFFLHAGWIHGLGNAAFLILFGEEVEDEIGGARFLALIAASELVGTAAETLARGGDERMVGASAGISGALVAYVILFRHREVEVPTSWFLPLAFRGRFWIALSAPWLLAVWGGFQELDLWMGSEHVATVAHLGGGAAGALMALHFRSR